jgi:GT2 family glycosyltransferase
MPPPHRTSTSATAAAPPTRLADLLDELDVAILLGNQAPWQLAALQAALAADLGPRWRGGALVVDDAAGPATARAAEEALASHHPLARRTVLRLHHRRGTAAAVNLALDELTAEYVALAQAGTRPEPGSLGMLVETLDEDPAALWAAPPVAGLAVVRRAAVLEIGGFDPTLRGHDAVADCAARATAAGRRTLVLPEATVHRDPGGVAANAHRMRGSLARRRAARRPWSAAALATWLPQARLSAERVDLA